MSFRKKSPSSQDENGQGAEAGEVHDGHEIKHDQLLKRHRHKNTWIARDVVLDITTGSLSYYRPKTHLARVASKISRTISGGLANLAKSPSNSDVDVIGEGEAEMKRSLPVVNLDVCILDTEGEEENSEFGGQGSILTISYSESCGSASNGTTSKRSIFFKSNKEPGSEEADEQIEDWFIAIQRVKESEMLSPTAGATGSSNGNSLTELPTIKSEITLAGNGDESDDDDSETSFVHCGWIYKKGSQLNSKWQKRWLFLDRRTHQLRYYKSPVEALANGEIPLHKCDQVKKGMPDLFPEVNPPNTFTVVCKQRSYWIRTESAEATQEWIGLISQCISSVGNGRRRSQSFSNLSLATLSPCPRRMTVSLSRKA